MKPEYVLLGWIAHDMDTYKDNAHAIRRGKKVRKPPKIYASEGIANRYGTAKPVYVKDETPMYPKK